MNKLFSVAAREVNGCGYREVLVVATSIRQARIIGVSALESKGFIERRYILDTDIYEKESEVWT